MTMQESLIDMATQSIAMRLKKGSLQKRVVNMDVVYGSVGVTFLNKDNTYFIEVWEDAKSNGDINYSNSMMDELIRIE